MFRCAFFVSLCLMLTTVTIRAQTISTKGTDFWLTFMQNSGVPNTYLFFGADSAATVKVYQGATLLTTLSIPANTNIPYQVMALSAHQTNSDVVNVSRAIRVTSDKPITLSAFNTELMSTDAAVILPVQALGDKYFVPCYRHYVLSGTAGPILDWASQFAVVAHTDATLIQITPSAPIAKAGGGLRPAGVPYSVTLNKGDVYQAQTDQVKDDLTGTLVQVVSSGASCGSIAVFSGHQRTAIPDTSKFSRDHLVEQIPPTRTWGTTFVVPPIAYATKFIVRILSSEPNTSVTFDGTTTSIAQTGGFIEYTVAGNRTYAVSADKPILVAQYAMTANEGFDPVRGVGDPFMIIVPPLEQRIDRFVFNSYVPPTSTSTVVQDGWRNNLYVALIGDKSELGNVTIDGLSITTIQGRAALPVVYGTIDATPQIQCVTVRVPEGIHSVDASNGKGVIGIMYGLTQLDSYGFLAGSKFNNIRTTISVRQPPFCPGKPLTFVGSSKDSLEITAWSWWFEHDSTSATGQSTQKTFKEPGTYRVRLIATRNGCSADTVFTTIEIKAAFTLTARAEPSPACVGQNVRLIASEPSGVGPLTYKWMRDSAFTSELRDTNQRTATVLHTAAGRFRYRVVAVDTGGCPVETTVWVVVVAPPRINVPDTIRICAGSTTRIDGIVSDTAGYAVMWTGPTGPRAGIVSNPALPSISLRVDSAGTYAYTLEATNKYGCKSQKSVVIVASSVPIITGMDSTTRISCLGANDPPVRIGENILVSGGIAPYRYTWRVKSGDGNSIIGPTDQRTAQVRPTGTTTYILRVTDSRSPVGCSSEFEITIQLRSVPDANAGPDRLLCVCRDTSGTTIGTDAKCGTPPFTYSWLPVRGLSNPTSSTSARTSAKPDVTTAYILTVTDAAQLISRDTVVVQVEQCPSIQLDTIHSACAAAPTIKLDPKILSDSLGMSYRWTPGWMVSDSTSRRPFVVAFDSTSSSELLFTAVSRLGCSTSASTRLIASRGLTVEITASSRCETDTICPSEMVQLQAMARGGVQPLTYSWKSRPDLGSNWTSSQQLIALQFPRTTQLVVTVTDSVGCTSSDTVNICVGDQASVFAGADTTICASDTLDASLSRGQPATCGREPIVYEWEPRLWCTVSDSTKPWRARLHPQTTTRFVLRATDDNGKGRTVSDTVTVNVLDSLQLAFGASMISVCEGDQPPSTTLTIIKGARPFFHRWFLPNSSSILSRSDSVSNVPSSAVSSFSRSGWLNVVTTDANGCSRRDSLYISIVPHPRVTVVESDSTCLCSERVLIASVDGGTPYPDGTYLLSWSEISADAPAGTTSLIDTVSMSARVRPRYTTVYTLRVTDANGCASSASITLAPPRRADTLTLRIPAITADPRKDDAPIAVLIDSSSAEAKCKPEAIEFTLQYNESLYDPFPTIESGIRLSSRVVAVGSERHRRVMFRVVPKETISNRDTLTRIHGKALVGSPAQTNLIIDSISVMWPCDTLKGAGIDGSLSLDSLCLNPANTRRVLVFNSATIASVRPNPNSGSFTVYVRLFGDTSFDLGIFSLQGERLWHRSIEQALKPTSGVLEVPVEAALPTGAYLLCVRSSVSSSVYPVMISQ
ncbi:MAG: PKD domain-containing protein [Candidatus Kapabacteria bacterium]|nr:PKD domain-containing protein [Candidatus Kapabacteria bacterium]